MIKEKIKLDNIKENKFIISLCDLDDNNKFHPSTKKLFNQYSHVKKEYYKYIKYYNKEKNNNIQYIPIDFYALYVVNTVTGKYIEPYDDNYGYIVNIYCLNNNKIDLNKLKKSLYNIRNLARKFNACICIDADYITDLNNEIIKEVFKESITNLYIYND